MDPNASNAIESGCEVEVKFDGVRLGAVELNRRLPRLQRRHHSRQGRPVAKDGVAH